MTGRRRSAGDRDHGDRDHGERCAGLVEPVEDLAEVERRPAQRLIAG